MSRLTSLLPPRPGAAGTDLRRQRDRDRSERATLLRARRRQGTIFLVLVAALVLLAGRSAYWQIGQHDALAVRADAEHLRALSFPAGRGEILDTNGNVLALSLTEDTVIADPDVIRAAHALDGDVAALEQALALPAETLRAQLDVPGAYVVVRGTDGHVLALTPGQTGAINDLLEQGSLAGVALYPLVRRVAPDGTLAAQVVGFVRTSDGVGQYGVEQQYQSLLAGTPGKLYTAVDAAGNPLATAPRREVPAVPGANVTLTLDATVQYWAEQGLARAISQTGADGGSVIALDPHTGAIIAMASQPSFDPNTYGQATLADFTNPVVTSSYDPGSTMKAVTMATGIDTGAITPESSFYDTGVTYVGATPLHNWDHIGHGQENMTQVLQYSANVGAVWVAKRVGPEQFNAYLRAFGFGSPTGVDLPSESPGQFGDPARLGGPELVMAENSFGESIEVTPLQMVAAYAALANHGTLMRPYIVGSVAADGGHGAVTTYGPHVVRQVVDPMTAQQVTAMLVNSAAVSEAQMNLVKGYSVAAKTGTSTPNAQDPTVTYASVIGYAPASNPRFVLLVKLDHPHVTIFGGSAAGPLWRQLAEQMFTYYRIPPDEPAA